MLSWIVVVEMIGTLFLAPPSDAGIARRVVAVQEAPGTIEAELNPSVYLDLQGRRDGVVEGFPLSESRVVDLELTAFEVLAADARLILVDESGEHEMPRPEFRAFRGRVRGSPGSSVTLTLVDGALAGSIRQDGDEFAIAPGARERTVRVWNRADDPDRPDRPFCDAHLPQAPQSGGGLDTFPRAEAAVTGDTLLTAQIAIDAPFEWYDHFGSLTDAQNYILAVMAQVSTIFHDEVLVDLEVPFLRVFTVPEDPYSDTTSASTLLAELRSEWNANQTGVDRTVAHLFGVRPSGGAGVAYLDVLCDNNDRPGRSYDYGVSTISARGGSWEKDLVAHEIGHNFSSRHTHCYVPEIDQCANQDGCYQGTTIQTVGTIMSYCNVSISEFHARVEDEQIRPAAEAAYPSCIATDDGETAPDPPQNLTVN